MIMQSAAVLPELYEADETAWLELMAGLIGQGRHADLDFAHLQEFLTDMALRDRREVVSRLTVLLAHRLKWDLQPEQRTRSWRTTIEVQRQELAALLESKTLHNHALATLAKAYANGVRQAASETGLASARFAAECPYGLETLLAEDWAGAEAGNA